MCLDLTLPKWWLHPFISNPSVYLSSLYNFGLQINCRVILNPWASVHNFADALLLCFAQLKAKRSSHAFEHYHWMMSGVFWVHVMCCCLNTGTDVSKASLQNGCFAFAGTSWLLMTRNKARRTQQRTEERKAQTASKSFILVALPSEHSKPISLAA